MPRAGLVVIVERVLDELRVLTGVVTVIAAWALYTVGAVPAATGLLGAVEGEAHSAPPTSVLDSQGRPALRACYRVSVAADDWSEDEVRILGRLQLCLHGALRRGRRLLRAVDSVPAALRRSTVLLLHVPLAAPRPRLRPASHQRRPKPFAG
jgi:hypothetical protein